MYGRGHQQPGMRIGPPITPPIIKQLMIANAGIFLIQKIYYPVIDVYGSVIPAAFWEHGYLWQPFTYMWLHASFGHIGMNMFSLWMFGSPLAMAWGPQRFLRFYLICGVGAGFIIATYPYFIAPFNPEALHALQAIYLFPIDHDRSHGVIRLDSQLTAIQALDFTCDAIAIL